MSQPLKKEQKTSDAAGDATTSLFLRVLRDANAVTHLSPFLTINDMTNLSMACKDTQEMFQKERESLSFSDVRSMVRRHTLIGYERKDEDLQWVAVSQRLPRSQNSNFFDEFPKPTRTSMRVKLVALETSTQTRERIFIGHPDSFSDGDWCFFVGENHDHTTEDKKWPEEDKQLLRRAMSIVHECTKLIGSNDEDFTEYPSAEYLMRTLPSWLYPYFPKSFDWEADHSDRETEVFFPYKKAKSKQEWLGRLPPMFDGIHKQYPSDLDSDDDDDEDENDDDESAGSE
ncbi:expressed unknown protein [Seminavis robusta]|uniref:Uncharacterized protein n=1 Tax=Seminavis robusta TaxID=568900 RepID=A0A9N8E6G4_9STRA|nr:expressed unknown protein [Seminavis robusta]|eukprot:Sro564_g167460.1 n/a (286) ;mRNA; r:47364-48331